MPPLGLLRGFATFRSGDHKNQIDLKDERGGPGRRSGARLRADRAVDGGRHTRASGRGRGRHRVISPSGARDLIDAYDMIAGTRLENQAGLIEAGRSPKTSLPLPISPISNAAICATPSSSCGPCNPPWAMPAAPPPEETAEWLWN